MAHQTEVIENRIQEAAQKEWSEIAKEEIKVEVICGAIYAFGSELACLRIYKAFNGKGTVKFSENLESWYFTK